MSRGAGPRGEGLGLGESEEGCGRALGFLRPGVRVAGRPGHPAEGSLAQGAGCACSLRVSEDRVWETELVGGRELWGPLIRSPRSGLGPLVQASWKYQPAELWHAVGLRAQEAVAGWATSLPGCPRIGPIRVCRVSLASRSLSRGSLLGHQSPGSSLSRGLSRLSPFVTWRSFS